MISQGLAIALLTLPVTLLLGAWLPLLSRHLTTDKVGGAVLYGVNAIGSAVGALAAGFVFIPAMGTTGTLILAAAMIFVFGMTWSKPRTWLILPLLVFLAVPIRLLPPASVLLPTTLGGSSDWMIHEDALGITHVVARADGQRMLLADLQRMDASSEPHAVVSQENQGRLPLMLHYHPKSVLFLGLGSGVSAAASLAYPDLERTAVELSQGAIHAARRLFSEVNRDVTSSMALIRDDARRYLSVSTKRYDVIIGDLFHPDLVGRSALLSTQQFQRALDALNQHGLFVQWLGLNQFDQDSMAVILRTFKGVFGNSHLFVDGARLALVGFRDGGPSGPATMNNLSRLSADGAVLATGGEGGGTWLGRYWGPIPKTEGQVQDEWAPVLEYQLPKARYAGRVNLVGLLEWLLSIRPRVDQAADILGVDGNFRPIFERTYGATDASVRSWQMVLLGRQEDAQRLLEWANQTNPQDRWVSGAIADWMFASMPDIKARGLNETAALERIIALHPVHAPSLRALWRLAQEAGRLDEAQVYRKRFAELSPLDASLRSRY